jgi:hypothetical protein
MKYGDPNQAPPPRYLQFSFEALPPEEREAAYWVRKNLDVMHHQLTRFRAALILFNNCLHLTFGLIDQGREKDNVDAGLDLPSQWTGMACRDGILSTYNISEMMQAVDAAVSKCPTLKDHRDTNLSKKARNILAEAFPRLELARHGAAHGAKFSATERSRRHHAAKDGLQGPLISAPAGGVIYVSDTIHGSTFSATVEGKLVSYDLTPESFAALRLAVGHAWDSFNPVEDYLNSQGSR